MNSSGSTVILMDRVASAVRLLCLYWIVNMSILALNCGETFALTLIHADISTMTLEAKAIVYGSISGLQTSFHEQRNEVITTYTMDVLEVLKQDTPLQKHIKVISPGGMYKGLDQTPVGLPKFERGEHLVLFLDLIDRQYWIYGFSMGTFRQVTTGDGRMRLYNDVQATIIDEETNRLIVPKPTYFEWSSFKSMITGYMHPQPKDWRYFLDRMREQYAQAATVLVGRVKAVETAEDARVILQRRIEIEPVQMIKGQRNGSLQLLLEGGELPHVRYVYPEAPSLVEGEYALLFLKEEDGHYVPIGIDAKWTVHRKLDGKYELLMGGQIMSLDDVIATMRK